MDISEILVPGFEKVVRGIDAASGLRAIVAVHDTTLGRSCGGIRMLPYATEQDALADVLRLAEGMTYKSAVANTGLGGGKAVLIGDPAKKTRELFRSLGRLVDSLGGAYVAAEDMNVNERDLQHVRETTRWVAGLADGSGNPSPLTALGVFAGLGAVLAEAFGEADFEGRTVLVQGLGAVGSALAKRLADAGARVVACDLDEAKAKGLAREHGWEHAGNDEWLDVECDVYSPCARGATLSDATIPRLKCRAVGGAANNQLAEPRHADALAARGIVYAPDYVINAGGIINVAAELAPGGYDPAAARRRTEAIAGTLATIVRIAREEGITSAAAAHRLARQRLEAAKAAPAS